jgi:hypothetical protein
MVPISWPSIRKEILGDFIQVRGVENNKSSFSSLIETNYEGFFGETTGYSNVDFAPNGLSLLQDNIEFSVVLTEEEVQKGEHEEHPKWLKYQAVRATDAQKVVYQLITSIGNGSQEVSFGAIKKSLLNPYKKERVSGLRQRHSILVKEF